MSYWHVYIICYYLCIDPNSFIFLLAITCAAVTDSLNGVEMYSMVADNQGNYPVGTEITVTCDNGFGRNGVETRTCVGDGSSSIGSFDGKSPTCERELLVNGSNQ